MITKTVAETYGNPPPKLFTGFKMEEECLNPTLGVGIEIEVEGVRHGEDELGAWCKPWGISIKGDGSLRVVDGRPAYEFITKPTAIRHVLPILREFFRKTEFGQTNFSDRTSIHVHADCSQLTWSTLANIALLYTVFEEIIFEFVNNRPGNRDGYSRDTNLYCVPWNQCRDHYNVVQSFLQDPSSVLGRWQKYTALNLAPLLRQNTIEFRHMHGTADMDKLKTWLNIIGSIFLYAGRRTHEELAKEIMEMNTVSRYEDFFNEVLGRSLPYNDRYRIKLEEGLIFAKYSMATSREKKKAAPADAAATVRVNMDAGTLYGFAAANPWDRLEVIPQAQIDAERPTAIRREPVRANVNAAPPRRESRFEAELRRQADARRVQEEQMFRALLNNEGGNAAEGEF